MRSAWLLIITLLVAGCAARAAVSEQTTETSEAHNAAAFGPTAPVWERPPAPDFRGLEEQLQAYLSELGGIYGIHVIDVASGAALGINDDLAFPAASTFKVPMAMYMLEQVALGHAGLDEDLAYLDRDWEDGTGVLQASVEGDIYSLGYLLELAITESDNIATNMLLRRFGRHNVYAYMERLGGTVTQFDPETNGTTPRELATYMRLLLSRRTLGDLALRAFLLDALANTSFHDRTAAGVPEGVKVAHKIGTLPGVANDVALVYAPGNTFVIAVMSMDVDEWEASGAIAEITRMVYDYRTALGPPATRAQGAGSSGG